MGIRFSVCGWKLFHLSTAEPGGRKRKLEGAPELIRVLPFLQMGKIILRAIFACVNALNGLLSFLLQRIGGTVPEDMKGVNALNGLLSFLPKIQNAKL